MRYVLPVAFLVGIIFGCEADERRMERAVEEIQAELDRGEDRDSLTDPASPDETELRTQDRDRFRDLVKDDLKALDRRIRGLSQDLDSLQRELPPDETLPLLQQMAAIQSSRATVAQEWGELRLIDDEHWIQAAIDVEEALDEVERRVDALDDALHARYG